MWIDTHCHLDAAEFDLDRDDVVARAREAGVEQIVVPAVDAAGLRRVARCAHAYGFAYALGIHPFAVARSRREDIALLRASAREALGDPRFVAIGEIGLDFTYGASDAQVQEWFYREQLGIAEELDLPVILHVRRSADRLLFHLRRCKVRRGIVHAFNGSPVQAQGFIDCGLRLGFGGASTYDGSLRIRRFASSLAPQDIVLETDAPDIPPQWLRIDGAAPRNEPSELARIAQVIAQLRGISPQELAAATRNNALNALPRLVALTPAPLPEGEG